MRLCQCFGIDKYLTTVRTPLPYSAVALYNNLPFYYVGITRLDRWKRAYELGLDPEPKVEELILQHGENSKYTEW